MNLPRHIAIIMDGNGRWAKRRLMPRKAGHWFGFKRAKEIVYFASEIGVSNLTLFAFGRENWKRPQSEVDSIMQILAEQIDKGCNELHAKNICVRFVGEKERLPALVINKINEAEHITANNSGLILNIAIDYSGQYDIIQAVNRILSNKNISHITTDDLASYLLTYPSPDPDLLIRTGGETRISNFLLFQLAYTEIYFTNIMWPQFNKKAFLKAIKWFNKKERRFGMTSQQVGK